MRESISSFARRLRRIDLVSAVRRELTNLDPALLVTNAQPIADLVDRAVSPRRFLVSLLTAFSAFAVILASLGIYGVVSYSVSERVQEIGVRMALGATAWNVRWQVLRNTLLLDGRWPHDRTGSLARAWARGGQPAFRDVANRREHVRL